MNTTNRKLSMTGSYWTSGLIRSATVYFITLFAVACSIPQNNEAPVAIGQSLSTEAAEELIIVLSATDGDGDPLTFTLTSSPKHGTISGSAPNLVYRPAQGFFGNDRIDFTASDGKDSSNTAAILIQVNPSSNVPPQVSSTKFTVFGAAELNIGSGVIDANNDPLVFTIIEQPKHGEISGMGPNIQYTPKPGFEGQDSFSYKVNDGFVDSEIAKAIVDVFAGDCQSSSFLGSPDNLFLHVPSKLGLIDLSPYHHPVSSNFEDSDHWLSRVDMSNKSIHIDLKNNKLSAADYSLSFRFQPHALDQQSILFNSSAIDVEQQNNQIVTHLKKSNGETITLTHSNTAVKTRTCNQLVVVVKNNEMSVYLNGIQQKKPIVGTQLQTLTGAININKHNGKIWDVRLYDTVLAKQDIDTLSENCSENSAASKRVALFPNFLCTTYVCEYWGDNFGLEFQQFEYYAKAQDETHERFIFSAGMYPRGEICSYPNVVHNQDLTLNEAIINKFTKPFGYHRQLERKNSQHWLHENFHSYQGALKRYSNIGGHKFLAEGSASWGADAIIPATFDTLLGYYTLHPHLPLWTIQNSPVDEFDGWEFKGGHQYGSHVFWSYLSNYVVTQRIIGDIFNDSRVGSEPTRIAFELLAKEGINMKEVFSQFASRITTWDIKHGEEYRNSENGSRKRMKASSPNLDSLDRKFSEVFTHAGTGNQWQEVGAKTTPGGWAFNAYQVTASRNSTYTIAVRADTGNSPAADFRARIVVHTPTTGKRRYQDLEMLPTGEESLLSINVKKNEILYLVVSATPDVFSGWDTYKYQYKIYPN